MIDKNKFGVSRFTQFQKCPRKHSYIYSEAIETESSIYTIPGTLFHEAIGAFLLGEDMELPLDKFRKLCLSGELEHPPDLLEYTVSKYLQYYADDFKQERCLAAEKTYTEPLDDDDYISATVDEVYERDGVIVLRDRKTSLKKLKYTHDDVALNPQLLFYVPYVENDLGIIIDAVQIDEIRFAKLSDIPINANGKPSADKRRLDLVTYEDYYDLLCSMGLDTNKDYQSIQEYLQKRGHPLFNRITIQILDQNIVNANMKDMLETYTTIKQVAPAYRVYGPLCHYCQFSDLCKLDMRFPSESEREIIIRNIQKKS